MRRPVVVRRGPGLLGTMAIGGVAYAAGSSAAQKSAQARAQGQQITQLQAEQAAMQQQMAQQPAPQQPQAAPPAGVTQEQKIEQLQKLAQLKQAGVLTDQEFETQKQKILAQ